MHKILALKPGDTIGIAALSSPFDELELKRGVERLQEMGFRVLIPEGLGEQKNSFLAGDDLHRASIFQNLIENQEVKAIFFARGGYGAQRVMEYLNWDKVEKNPKIILGYSDLTTLFLYLTQKLSWVVFHGPVVAKGFSQDFGPVLKTSFDQLLCQSDWPALSLQSCTVLKMGYATGKVVGGCLTLLQASLKLPWEIDLKDKILFIEDVGEAPYRVDRMLQHLKMAGKFKGLRGLICGPFCGTSYSAQLYQEVILDCFGSEDIPIVYGFPSGHHPDMQILPLGAVATLDTDKQQLQYLLTSP